MVELDGLRRKGSKGVAMWGQYVYEQSPGTTEKNEKCDTSSRLLFFQFLQATALPRDRPGRRTENFPEQASTSAYTTQTQALQTHEPCMYLSQRIVSQISQVGIPLSSRSNSSLRHGSSASSLDFETRMRLGLVINTVKKLTNLHLGAGDEHCTPWPLCFWETTAP